MKKQDYFLKSLLPAVGVLMYVSLIATFFFNAERLFDKIEPHFFIPIFMLLLLIISATVTGSLVLGKPLMLYFEGQKKEAFLFLFATLGWLAVFLVGVGSLMLLIQ